MIKVIARMDFIFNGTGYIAGDEVEVDDIVKIAKLNELGYIEPLSYKDLVLLERQLKKEKEML